MDPSGWTSDELARVSSATELELTSRRPDETYRPSVTIWVVGVADRLYVRSARGWNNGWFQRALQSSEGRIRTAGVERDVAFEQPGPDVADAVTAAYRSKYDRYGPSIVGTVISAEAVKSTLRLVRR
jgi:hypothetical protein